MAAVSEVTLGADDGSSRLIRARSPSADDARSTIQRHMRPDETVIFTDVGELDETDDAA